MVFISFNYYKNYNAPLSAAHQIHHKEKIGVLVIALGRYDVFWEKLYKSSEKYFLPGYEKHYYIFTDSKNLKYKDKENVHVIPHKKMGWPYDSMLRYNLFISQWKVLSQMDYLYFMNINMVFREIVGDEVLPQKRNNGLMVLTHFGFARHNANPDTYSYDRNPKSTAYIPYGQGNVYAPGGFNGGTSKAFLKLSFECDKMIRQDLKNKIIAKWQDESYLNKYILDKNPLILPPYYMWPMDEYYQNSVYVKRAKTLLRDKKNYGGKWWLRGSTDIKSTPFSRLKYLILSNIALSPEKRAKYRDIYAMLQH